MALVVLDYCEGFGEQVVAGVSRPLEICRGGHQCLADPWVPSHRRSEAQGRGHNRDRDSWAWQSLVPQTAQRTDHIVRLPVVGCVVGALGWVCCNLHLESRASTRGELAGAAYYIPRFVEGTYPGCMTWAGLAVGEETPGPVRGGPVWTAGRLRGWTGEVVG